MSETSRPRIPATHPGFPPPLLHSLTRPPIHPPTHSLARPGSVESEGLQAHAARVGEYMRQRLRELAAKHEIIGDVRGEGLFIGIDFVKDRATRAPAIAECR